MKKKILVGVAALLVMVVAIFVLATNLNRTDTANSSRRDGAVAEGGDNLEGIDGSLTADSERSYVYEPEDEGSEGLTESVINSDVTSPLSKEVEAVRTITLSEAIAISDGDVAAFYSSGDYENVTPVDAKTYSFTEIPDKYDSRDVDGKRYVTEVEDQGYSYLCWTYACMGAIECDILKHHDVAYTDIDLSEKHIAYYNMHKAEGSVNSYIDNDYRELVNTQNQPDAWVVDNDAGYIAMGGVNDFCISILTAWKGPVPELGADKFASLYGERYIFSDNKAVPSDAFTAPYHVQDVGELVASLDNNTYIKQMIMEHGGVTIGVNADNIFWKDHNKTLYSFFGGEPVPTANHEVLVVGWDDNYPASNFRTAPEADGAWICRNSWGSSSGEGGFFYLSYYDETTQNSNAAFYHVAAETDKDYYDNNYQVAGFLTQVDSSLDDAKNSVYAYTSSANPYGTLYEAASSETLKAIGVMAIDSYQQYQICIYVNPVVNSVDGSISLNDVVTPTYCQKVSAISGGFHTFTLEKEIQLSKGDVFFVVVNPYTSGRLVYEKAMDYTSAANYDEWKNLTGNVHNNYEASGRSYYISLDGQKMESQSDKDFFVKAYTVNN